MTKGSWTTLVDKPGGKVTLVEATEKGQSGLTLGYDFCAGGASMCASAVAATWKPAKPVPAAGLHFRARTRDHGDLFVEVTDDAGQTFRYWQWRTPEAEEGDLAPYRIVFSDQDKEPGFPYETSHYGGLNDGVFSGSIKSVRISYGTFFGKQIAGDLFFTDVVVTSPEMAPIDAAVDVASGAFHVPDGATDPADRLVGVSFHPRGDKVNKAAQLGMVKDFGFDFVRTEFSWKGVESQKGVYDLANVKEFTGLAASAGLGLHVILDYGNELYSGNPDNLPNPDKIGPDTQPFRDAFVAYAQQIVKATRGPGVHYEIWNEPNGPAFWKPAPSAADYGLLCKATVVGVKPLMLPGQRIGGGNLANSSAAFAFQRQLEDSGGCFADTTAGIPTDYAYHAYRSTPETWAQELNQIRTQLPGHVVLGTEWGDCSTRPHNTNHASEEVDGTTPAARRRQAVETARRFLVETAVGLPWSTYYDFLDDGTKGLYNEDNWGLFDTKAVIKPAGVAARTLLALSKSHPFSGWLAAADGRVHAARFRAQDETRLVVWTDAWSKVPGKQPSFRVHVRCEGLADKAVDVVGADVAIDHSGADCSVLVSEDGGPVTLTYGPSCAP
jgi:hypothetical protein